MKGVVGDLKIANRSVSFGVLAIGAHIENERSPTFITSLLEIGHGEVVEHVSHVGGYGFLFLRRFGLASCIHAPSVLGKHRGGLAQIHHLWPTRVGFKPQRVKVHALCVIEQQGTAERSWHAQQKFDGLSGLKHPYHSRKYTKDPCFGTGRHGFCRRGFRK